MERTTTNSTVLPDYVEQRNRRAADAGLIRERQRINSCGRLTTWYRGTARQLEQAGIAPDAEELVRAAQGSDSCLRGAIQLFSPLRHAFHATLHRMGGGQFRMIVANERLPIEFAVIKAGIRVYWYERGWAHRPTLVKVFVASTRAELVGAGVAPRKILSMDCEQYGHGDQRARRVTLWRIEERRCGVVVYETYPSAMAKAAAAKRTMFVGSQVPAIRVKELERAHADPAFQKFLQQLQGKSSDVA